MREEIYYKVILGIGGCCCYYKAFNRDTILYFQGRDEWWIKTYYSDGEDLERRNKSWGNSIEVISKDIFERDMFVRELIN